MNFTRRALLAASLAPLATPTLAQGEFPNRPLRMVIPFPPGGGSDILGRLLAQRMGDVLGQPVVPENRAGAGGNIGTDMAAKAAPDGYTMVTVFNTIVVNQFIFRSMPFDLKRDLTPLGRVALAPTLIAGGPKLRAADLREVVEITRRQPGLLNHGTPGLGTITHVSAELMDSMSGGKLTHVHYRGTGPAVTAAVSGEVELVSAPLSAVDELIKGGRLRALGNLAGQPSPLMPGLPTVAEAAGLPGYAVDNWGAVLLPAGVPAPILAKLAAALRQAVDTPEGKAALAARGIEAAWADGATVTRIIQEDEARWEPVIRKADIKVE
ncbi:tripartite tricarboxylate transporter substrate binding protein [Siccirubricoccus sp. KC 17139]|uniref:Tripartite tricarboxylate transporter substrate binding protein n=1 Tax=Siccirubricoccus soli TaxID=2899147 RepID=A0ABT1D5G3_9PROT|nr:tripartite tricarboxylate transporter substrate-binding protein [Siccirubricoccus soli]MCO6416867.1 tripartite tricarboxylate transporter substrate binding protein [Siccirubricoccus soli]MCP2683002.1 tripartite tricarboxylate transporter substrate-binding protein [Siccirubricoccus soli]